MIARRGKADFQRQRRTGRQQHDGTDRHVRHGLAEDEDKAADRTDHRQLEPFRHPLPRQRTGRRRQQGDDRQNEDSAERKTQVQLARPFGRAIPLQDMRQAEHPSNGRHNQHRQRPRTDERAQFQHHDLGKLAHVSPSGSPQD